MFFFNDTATTEIYTLSLHDALPISRCGRGCSCTPGGACSSPSSWCWHCGSRAWAATRVCCSASCSRCRSRSEEHTSELQSRQYLVCRLLLEKKKTIP